MPTARSAPPYQVPLTLRVCYDLHVNKTCDVDEGVQGLWVYAADPATGQILAQVPTDATGLARFTWGVAPDTSRTAQVNLSVPYLQQVRLVRAADPRAAPVIITTLAPLPAWLP